MLQFVTHRLLIQLMRKLPIFQDPDGTFYLIAYNYSVAIVIAGADSLPGRCSPLSNKTRMQNKSLLILAALLHASFASDTRNHFGMPYPYSGLYEEIRHKDDDLKDEGVIKGVVHKVEDNIKKHTHRKSKTDDAATEVVHDTSKQRWGWSLEDVMDVSFE